MHLLSKRERCVQFVEQHVDNFICPSCHKKVELQERKSLVCSNGHRFDLAKKGYIHLLNQSSQTKYDNELFIARRNVMGGHFFEPVIEKMAEITNQFQGSKTIVDAGCGEGSHLHKLQAKLSGEVIGFGLDIAKEGIQQATSLDSHTAWIVADLANCPLADESVDFIYNILSPSNYSEFQRLLKKDGLLLKVIPNREYLYQIRELFYKNEKEYDNEQTKQLFDDKFSIIQSERIKYDVKMEQPLLNDLIRMTPLSWSASEEQLKKVQDITEQTITVDVTILIGRK